MGADGLQRLEARVDVLVRTLRELRDENRRLREELAESQRTIQETEAEKHNLSASIGSLQGDSEVCKETLNAAADKLESIISRLESAG